MHFFKYSETLKGRLISLTNSETSFIYGFVPSLTWYENEIANQGFINDRSRIQSDLNKSLLKLTDLEKKKNLIRSQEVKKIQSEILCHKENIINYQEYLKIDRKIGWSDFNKIKRIKNIIDKCTGIFTNNIQLDVEIANSGGYEGFYYIAKDNKFIIATDEMITIENNDIIIDEGCDGNVTYLSEDEVKKSIEILEQIIEIIYELNENPVLTLNKYRKTDYIHNS